MEASLRAVLTLYMLNDTRAEAASRSVAQVGRTPTTFPLSFEERQRPSP